MIKRFKRKVEREGIMDDLKKHSYFVSKSVKRRIKSEAARRMAEKKSK